jgi:hypothetical protein
MSDNDLKTNVEPVTAPATARRIISNIAIMLSSMPPCRPEMPWSVTI